METKNDLLYHAGTDVGLKAGLFCAAMGSAFCTLPKFWNEITGSIRKHLYKHKEKSGMAACGKTTASDIDY